jgi:hypothetical protein
MKIEGSGSASGSEFISQRHGSADPDPNPQKNVMDPEHCWNVVIFPSSRLPTLFRQTPIVQHPFFGLQML